MPGRPPACTRVEHLTSYPSPSPTCAPLQLLDEYFGKEDELDPAGAFLKSFIANKAWKDPHDRGGRARKRIKGLDGGSGSSSSDDDGDSGSEDGEGRGGGVDGMQVDDEEDEEFLEQVDRFEAAYNFRWVLIPYLGQGCGA